jgi:undecaprenyl-diphosphatase
VFAFFLLLSFKSRVYGNWPGAAYLTGSLLIVAYFGAQPAYASKGRLHRFGIRLWPWALVTSYLITAIILSHTACPFLPVPQKLDRVSRELSGWEKVGKMVGKTRRKMLNPERTFIFGFKYQNASELAFYVPGQPRTVSINRFNRPNVYDFWWEDKDIKGWDGVGIVDDPIKHEKIKQFFKRVDPPEKVPIYRDNTCMLLPPKKKPMKVFYIYRGYGFLGGLRWKPENGEDIRKR